MIGAPLVRVIGVIVFAIGFVLLSVAKERYHISGKPKGTWDPRLWLMPWAFPKHVPGTSPWYRSEARKPVLIGSVLMWLGFVLFLCSSVTLM